MIPSPAYLPLTARTWDALVTLFGARGACGGCWCMAWRLPPAAFRRQQGDGNKKALHALVKTGDPLGVLAFSGQVPIGWCAVAPRSQFVRLENSRILAPVDDKPVWSVTCLFLAKEYRKRGISAKLIAAAANFARKNDAAIVEAYPFDQKTRLPDPFVWTGLASSYRNAGFKEAARRSPTRPIMRKHL